MSEGEIKLGTSGYSFEDWRGAFYPQDIPKGEMLNFYAGRYKTVEINSTYYSIPHPAVFYHLSNKTPDDFEFIVKLNKESTHTRKEGVEAFNKVIDSVKYLSESKKLHGFLAQFPYSFKANQDNMDYMLKLREKSAEVPFWVEFRNIYWVKPKVYEFLKANDIGYCNVDQPALKGLIPPQDISTSDIGYVRFHGRNKESWWGGTVDDRYNYAYVTDEMEEWLDKIRELRKKTSKTYLFFNNCHLGNAVKNAEMMQELLKNQMGIEI
ncbi:DUF72 domain-containing protein [candidate division KSB1 bacterium]